MATLPDPSTDTAATSPPPVFLDVVVDDEILGARTVALNRALVLTIERHVEPELSVVVLVGGATLLVREPIGQLRARIEGVERG